MTVLLVWCLGQELCTNIFFSSYTDEMVAEVVVVVVVSIKWLWIGGNGGAEILNVHFLTDPV